MVSGRLAAVLLLASAPAAAHNGYTFSRTGGGQFTGTRVSLLDPADPHIAKFANGVSVTLWIRFNDLSKDRIQIPLAINTVFQDNLFQVFGGMHGGFFFGGSGPSAVKDLGEEAKNWHHYAFTWDDSRNGTGNVTFYVDGKVVEEGNQKLEKNWWEESAYVIVGASGYASKWMKNEPHSVNSLYSLDGEVDDVGVYAKVLSGTEIQAMFSTSSQADGAANDDDLILFWDFNDGPNGGIVPNKGKAGKAGGDYDLLMGKLPKPDSVPADSEARTMIDDVGGGIVPLTSAFIIPGSVPKGVPDETAPLVLTAAAGETVDSTEHGVTFSWTALTTFNETYTTVDPGSGIAIHVVPKMPPVGTEAAYTKVSGREDTPLNLQLWGRCEWAAGWSLVPKIKVMPTGGDLYIIDDMADTHTSNIITAVGDLVTSYGRYVRYVPHLDGASASAGALYDTFSYSLVVDGVEGAATTVEIVIASVNDLPVVKDISYKIDEDQHYPAGLAIPLNATDSDQDIVFRDYRHTVSITTFPTKGDLYHTTDGTVGGKYGDPIGKEYSHFDVGGDVSSAGYVPTENLAVSSFWGNPPNTGYHPLNMLGEQSCWSYGECPNEQPWVTDKNEYPLPGAHVLHQAPRAKRALTARVVSTEKSAGTVTIEYLKMYKLEDGTAPNGPEGNFIQCHIDMSETSMEYPADCTPVPAAVQATVNRSELSGTSGDNWCPLQKAYGGPNNRKIGAGAFGVQNAYDHQQADYYLTAGYTEYIELRIPTPTYVVMVEFGASRGMGAIVGVKAKNPDGEWVALYKGKALVGDSITYKETSTYWQWAPPSVCRTNFKARDFRVELDTSAETGVEDWNEYDYMKVYGSPTLQPAVLPYGENFVVYVPHEHASGDDSFTYSASDCTGDLFRSSKPSTVSFTIKPVNDAPVATNDTQRLYTSKTDHTSKPCKGEKDFPIHLTKLISDVEEDRSHLSINITSLPSVGKVFDNGEPVESLPHKVTHPEKLIHFNIHSPPETGCPYHGYDEEGFDESVICDCQQKACTRCPHPFSDIPVSDPLLTKAGKETNYRDVLRTSIGYKVIDEMGANAMEEVHLEIISTLDCPAGSILAVDGSDLTCEKCPIGTYESQNLLCKKVDPAHYISEIGQDESGKVACPQNTQVSETFKDQTPFKDQSAKEVSVSGWVYSDSETFNWPPSVTGRYYSDPETFQPGQSVTLVTVQSGMLLSHPLSVGPRSGGVAEEDCTCIPGTYATDTAEKPPNCIDKPDGSMAIGGTFKPVAEVGWGKLSKDSRNFYECNGFQRCPGPTCDCLGGISTELVAEMKNTTTNTIANATIEVTVAFRCNEGYVQGSPLCSLCESEEGYALNLGQCNKCEMHEWAYPFIALCLVVGWFAVGGRLSEKFESLEILFALVGFFGLYSNFSIQWSDFYDTFFSSCSFFNVDVDLVHIACFGKMSYSALWSIQTFLPAIYIVYTIIDLISSYLISKMVAWPDFPPVKLALTLGWRPRSSFSVDAIVSYYMPKGMLYMHMYYLTGVSKTIEMYKCSGSDGERYLTASPAITCWEGEHVTLVIINAFASFVYLIFTPLFYGYLLFVLVPKRGLYDPKLNANFGFVWGRFEEQYYWWEAVEMIRKLGLCLVQVLVEDPIVQTQSAVVIVGILLVTNLMFRPYIKFRYDVYDVVCSATEIAIMLLGNMVYHRRNNPDKVSVGGPEFVTAIVLIVAAVVSLFNIVIDVRDLIWELKLSSLRVKKGLRMSGVLEVSPPLLAYLDAADKKTTEDMRKFEGMLMKANLTYNSKKAQARRDRYRAMFSVEPSLLDWLLMPDRKGKDGPLCKFVSMLMNDHKLLGEGKTKFSKLIELSGPVAPPLALWLSEGATSLERDLVTRINTDLVTFEKEQWKPSLADKFHRVDEVPLAMCKMFVKCIMSIPCFKPKEEKTLDNNVDDFARLRGRMLALAKNEQFQLQSELERLLHELQMRLNGQALIIMPAPVKKDPNAMPTKTPKLELVRAVLTYDDETAEAEALKKEILDSNKWVDWSLGADGAASADKGQSPSSVCYNTGTNVVIKNMLLDKQFARVKNKGSLEVLSQLCVPLISQDPSTPPIIGVLCAINKVSFSGGSWGIPFTEQDIEDAELFASMVCETFEGFTARAGARKAISMMQKKGIGGFPKGGLISAAKAAEAKMEAEGILGKDPVRVELAAEKAAAEKATAEKAGEKGVTINITST